MSSKPWLTVLQPDGNIKTLIYSTFLSSVLFSHPKVISQCCCSTMGIRFEIEILDNPSRVYSPGQTLHGILHVATEKKCPTEGKVCHSLLKGSFLIKQKLDFRHWLILLLVNIFAFHHDSDQKDQQSWLTLKDFFIIIWFIGWLLL